SHLVVVQVLRDGLVVRQSEPIWLRYSEMELQISGVAGLYMEGSTADLNATVYPERPGDEFLYRWEFSKDGALTVWSETSELPLAVQQVLTVAEHNGGRLRVAGTRVGWASAPSYTDSVAGASP